MGGTVVKQNSFVNLGNEEKYPIKLKLFLKEVVKLSSEISGNLVNDS